MSCLGKLEIVGLSNVVNEKMAAMLSLELNQPESLKSDKATQSLENSTDMSTSRKKGMRLNLHNSISSFSTDISCPRSYFVTRCSSNQKLRVTTPTNPKWIKNSPHQFLTSDSCSTNGIDRPPTPYPFSNTDEFIFE